MSVSPPTLPRYISTIYTICEEICSSGVIPNVSPTVPTANDASYRQEDSGRFSYALIKTPPPKNSARYIVRMVAVVLTAPQSTLRPKNWALPRCRKVAAASAAAHPVEWPRQSPIYIHVLHWCTAHSNCDLKNPPRMLSSICASCCTLSLGTRAGVS